MSDSGASKGCCSAMVVNLERQGARRERHEEQRKPRRRCARVEAWGRARGEVQSGGPRRGEDSKPTAV